MSGLNLVDRLLIFLTVLVILELTAFALFWVDKAAARNGGGRVRERTLLLSALFGGIGAWLGLILLRHKTRKEGFRSYLRGISALHLILVSVVVYWVSKG